MRHAILAESFYNWPDQTNAPCTSFVSVEAMFARRKLDILADFVFPDAQ